MTLATRNNNFSIAPQNLTEAITFAEMVATSSFCPKSFQGKKGDVLIAIQMGAEIGLSPMQALQNISVINGKPSLWGDAALAVVMAHPCYISHREWTTGKVEDGSLVAHCAITRKNSEEYVVSFSIEDAKKADLWNKQGPWKQYPKRMLQMRARAFAIRDKFADALRGVNLREEVQDYAVVSSKGKNVIDMMPVSAEVNVPVEPEPEKAIEARDIGQDIMDISWAQSQNELRKVYEESYKHWITTGDKDSIAQIIAAKNKRKAELEENEGTVDPETGEVTE